MTASEEWAESCQRVHGRLLVGTCAHWCPDSDDMPIDETCTEMARCTCLLSRGTS